MNIFIKHFKYWLDRHIKLKQWVWFITLWSAGLMTVITISYPIKWIIKTYLSKQ